VIAIENVRQFRELQARLEREAATRDILEVISQSRDDDHAVFALITRSAALLCGAPVCTLWRVENGMIHYCSSHGLYGEALADAELTPAEPLADEPPAENTMTGRVYRTRAVAWIDDATDESYIDHEWVRARGLKDLVGVPIFVGSEVWGSINPMWPPDRPPRDADIQLVESFAAQAAIAIENVRQFRELQDRLEREAATRNILRVISESPDDEQPTFEAILDSATRLCGTQYASLVLGRRGDASQKMVAHRASRGRGRDFGLFS
jgi:GAF domain-containing protein